MLLEETQVAEMGPRELKVRIPAKLHIQLHALKIMRGEPIGETVAAALTEYLAKRAAPGV